MIKTAPVPRGASGSAFDNFRDKPLGELLALLEATPAERSDAAAEHSWPKQHGATVARPQLPRFSPFLCEPLVVILVAASTVSTVLGDALSGLIIIAMVLLSVLLNFFMEFQARHAVEQMQKQVATTAAALRDGKEQELSIADLVRATSSG